MSFSPGIINRPMHASVMACPKCPSKRAVVVSTPSMGADSLLQCHGCKIPTAQHADVVQGVPWVCATHWRCGMKESTKVRLIKRLRGVPLS